MDIHRHADIQAYASLSKPALLQKQRPPLQNPVSAVSKLFSDGNVAARAVKKGGISDEANGCSIENQDFLCLKVCLAGSTFAFCCSADG